MKEYLTHIRRFLVLAAIVAPFFAVGYLWQAPSAPLFCVGFVLSVVAGGIGCNFGFADSDRGWLWGLTIASGACLADGALTIVHGFAAPAIVFLWLAVILLGFATRAWGKI